MARWLLREDHYIHARMGEDLIEWEYTETDRVTGRERRKRFPVPLYCPSGWIICNPGSEQSNDNGAHGPVIFEGKPTPGMEPIDDEARAITKAEEHKWVHPIDSLPGQGFTASLLGSLEAQLAKIAAQPGSAPVAASGVLKEEFEQLKNQMAELMAKNAELEASKGGSRRKVA